jgi:hypothetical protein
MTSGVGLSAPELLEVVDAGASASAAERGQLLLAAVLGADDSPEELGRFSVGAREGWLLELRRETFGDPVGARVGCPACGQLLALEIGREHLDLERPTGEEASSRTVRLDVGGIAVLARSPDGAALVAAADQADVAAARRSLIASCVVEATRDGAPLEVDALDDEALEAIGEAIVAADPQVEVRLELECAGCGHAWSPILDMTLFMWRELAATSVQLLDEVHELAAGYGWSEPQILSLSSRRRRQYVERMAGG